MDLFEFADEHNPRGHLPLGERMRPKRWSDFVGQSRVHQELSRYLNHPFLPSLILWGPPGCGKTTFAKMLSSRSDRLFVEVNGVEVGAKALAEEGERGRRRRIERSQSTVLFVDEIHRLNRAQQDVLLSYVERGDLTLIGATTENPSYRLNGALLSRCRLIVFDRLSVGDLHKLLERALAEKGIKEEQILTSEAISLLLESCDGDGRRLFNVVESLIHRHRERVFPNGPAEPSKLPLEIHWPLTPEPLTPEQVKELLGTSHFFHDQTGDLHYDTISAFIKSIRGSDPNAGLYYLARMLEGGEDPLFVARRLLILASEDVGNADPQAISVALAGFQAVEVLGMPECGITLAQVVTYLARAPKSNRSYLGLLRAKEDVKRWGHLPIPAPLRSAGHSAVQAKGVGIGYKCPHDEPNGWVEQDYLPSEIRSQVYYEPSGRGEETVPGSCETTVR